MGWKTRVRTDLHLGSLASQSHSRLGKLAPLLLECYALTSEIEGDLFGIVDDQRRGEPVRARTRSQRVGSNDSERGRLTKEEGTQAQVDS